MAKKKTSKSDTSTPNTPPPEAPPGNRTPDQTRYGLKRKVRIFYDLQRLRIQIAGRTYKRPEGTQIDLHPYDVKMLGGYLDELVAAEKRAYADIEEHLASIPFYVEHVEGKYKGLGPTMSAVILAECNIVRQDTPSKMWAFLGLAPVPAMRCKLCQAVVKDGEAANTFMHTPHGDWKPKPPKPDEPPPKPLPPCVKEKEVLSALEVFASGKTMRPEKGKKLPYNAWARTKVVGVMGGNLLKANSPWRKAYDDYKHRKASSGWGRSDGHRHNAAIRYMVKMVLLDIWKNWRAFEGLEVRPSYQEEKLGHTHAETGT